MTNLLTVLWYEFSQQFTRKAFLFVTFGLPLLALILFGGYLLYDDLRSDSTPQDDINEQINVRDPMGYVDRTGFFAPPDADSPLANYIIFYDDFEAGMDALRNEDISQFYEIEADYFETGTVTQWLDHISLDATDSDLLEAFLVMSMAEGNAPEVVARLRFPLMSLTEQRIQRTSEGSIVSEESSFGTDFLQVYIFAMVLMISTFWSSGYLMQSIVEEKQSQMLEIILTSVKPFPLLLGKTLAMSFVGLLQLSLWLGTVYIIGNLAAARIIDLSNLSVAPDMLLVSLVYFLLGFGFVGGMYASIASLVNTTREGSQVAGFVVMPLVVPLFFVNVFVQDPNGTLARILSLIPITAPLAMVMRSAISNVPPAELALSILLMAALVMGSIWLAARLFRVNSLLRGTMPKFRDIPKLLFERS